MTSLGPALEVLTRRLSETPADFLAEPRIGSAGVVNVAAVVSDLLRDLGGQPLGRELLAAFQTSDARKHRNRLSIVLIGCWLLGDPWFAQQPGLAVKAYQTLSDGLSELAEFVKAPQFVSDPDRREELARFTLNQLGLRPAGESEAQSQDRLTTLSSAERQRVVKAARAAEERARAVREAMARQAAQEAADKATRE
jgi:hypothetical protein